jgi:hypothetical protein
MLGAMWVGRKTNSLSHKLGGGESGFEPPSETLTNVRFGSRLCENSLGQKRTKSPCQNPARYLHRTVRMESDPLIACPLKVLPVSEAEVFPHTMPVS